MILIQKTINRDTNSEILNHAHNKSLLVTGNLICKSGQWTYNFLLILKKRCTKVAWNSENSRKDSSLANKIKVTFY